MFWLKCCPRCDDGDLYPSADMYGSYVACLQCGYYLTEAEEVALRYASRSGLIARSKKNNRTEPVLVGGAR